MVIIIIISSTSCFSLVVVVRRVCLSGPGEHVEELLGDRPTPPIADDFRRFQVSRAFEKRGIFTRYPDKSNKKTTTTEKLAKNDEARMDQKKCTIACTQWRDKCNQISIHHHQSPMLIPTTIIIITLSPSSHSSSPSTNDENNDNHGEQQASYITITPIPSQTLSHNNNNNNNNNNNQSRSS